MDGVAYEEHARAFRKETQALSEIVNRRSFILDKLYFTFSGARSSLRQLPQSARAMKRTVRVIKDALVRPNGKTDLGQFHCLLDIIRKNTEIIANETKKIREYCELVDRETKNHTAFIERFVSFFWLCLASVNCFLICKD